MADHEVPPGDTPTLWDLIYSELASIADEEEQRQCWFRLDPTKMDSPGDLIHRFFGYRLVEDFVATEPKASNELKNDLSTLQEAITAYQREVGFDPDPFVTIDHPHWREIRQLARKVIDSAVRCGLPTIFSR